MAALADRAGARLEIPTGSRSSEIYGNLQSQSAADGSGLMGDEENFSGWGNMPSTSGANAPADHHSVPKKASHLEGGLAYVGHRNEGQEKIGPDHAVRGTGPESTQARSGTDPFALERPQRPLTVPHEPKLASLERARRVHRNSSGAGRQKADVPAKRAPGGLTVPRAPKLLTSLRAGASAGAGDGSDRHARTGAGSEQRSFKSGSGTATTAPGRAPRLETMRRQRKVEAKAFEEAEEEQVERAKAQFAMLRQRTESSFRRIFGKVPRASVLPGGSGNPVRPVPSNRSSTPMNTSEGANPARRGRAPVRRSPTELTKPRAPQLQTETMSRSHNNLGVAGVGHEDTRSPPPRRRSGLTKPLTPALSCFTEDRRASHAISQESDDERTKFKARPMPPPPPPPAARAAPKVTESAPFALSEPMQTSRRDSDASGRHSLKGAARVPRQSQECGETRTGGQKRKLTVPKPFELLSEALHELSLETFASRRELEEAQDREQRSFIARPLPDLSRVWQPEHHDRDWVGAAIDSVELATERRAQEREHWNETQRLLAEELKLEQERIREDQERRKERELAEYRRSLQFKARPIGFRRDPSLSEAAAP